MQGEPELFWLMVRLARTVRPYDPMTSRFFAFFLLISHRATEILLVIGRPKVFVGLSKPNPAACWAARQVANWPIPADRSGAAAARVTDEATVSTQAAAAKLAMVAIIRFLDISRPWLPGYGCCELRGGQPQAS